MDLHEALARLTRSLIFKDWHKTHKEYFLAHAFVMLDEANKGIWQIGFYSAEKERMVTFVLSPDSVKHTEEQEVLRSEGAIQALKPDEVTFTVEDALKKANECMKEHYKQEMPVKQFFIIQNAEGHSLFNITYITQSFKTINIKIDAKKGDIIKHSSQSLAEFG